MFSRLLSRIFQNRVVHNNVGNSLVTATIAEKLGTNQSISKNLVAESRWFSSAISSKVFMKDFKWNSSLFSTPEFQPILAGNVINNPVNNTVPIRTVTKFNRAKGKRKSVQDVLHRFYRLDWGIWIRTIAGRDKHKWRKTRERRRRNQQHVFCNSTQSWMLDKMVTKRYRMPKYFVDDPYNPYHKRDEYWTTRSRPLD